MKIQLNGKEHEIETGTTLSQFIASTGIKTNGIAVAIDNEVITRSIWDQTVLKENDNLILIKGASGG